MIVFRSPLLIDDADCTPSFKRKLALLAIFPYTPSWLSTLFQGLSSESRKNEASLVDLRVVVSAQLLLLLGSPGPDRDLQVAVGILGADHESNLAGGIRRDGGVSVLGHGEDLLAVLLQLGDQRQVQPLVLS